MHGHFPQVERMPTSLILCTSWRNGNFLCHSESELMSLFHHEDRAKIHGLHVVSCHKMFSVVSYECADIRSTWLHLTRPFLSQHSLYTMWQYCVYDITLQHVHPPHTYTLIQLTCPRSHGGEKVLWKWKPNFWKKHLAEKQQSHSVADNDRKPKSNEEQFH